MASRTIYTGIFRTGFPHLETPHAANKDDDPKFSVQAMFPKTGVCPVNNKPICTWDAIFKALDEVCMEQWKLTFEQAAAPGMGVQFPPRFQDGDQKFEKDANKNPIPGKVRPETAGMWIISFKNADPVGVASPTGEDISPKSVYAGCWGRAQVEVSAYDGKQGRVIAIKLLNYQMAYDGEPLGGKTPQQSAGEAFGAMAIEDSNVTPGTHAPAIPSASPAAPGAPAPAPAAQPQLVQVPGAQYTIEACRGAGWTDQQMIDAGIAKMEEPAPKPAAPAPTPSAPPAPGPAPATAGAAPAPTMPAPTASTPPPAPNAAAPVAAPAPAGSAPAAPPAPAPAGAAPAPSTPPPPAAAPATGTVKMKPNSPYTYEALHGAGWTDQQIIDAGHADPDFTR